MSIVHHIGPKKLHAPSPNAMDEAVEKIWASLKDYFKFRSLRRVYAVVGGAGVLLAAWYIYRKISNRAVIRKSSTSHLSACNPSTNSIVDRTKACYSTCGKDQFPPEPVYDHVVIHCCPRGYYVPSIATEPLKLETFMRVADIPYEVKFCNAYESPLLTYAGKSANDFRESVRILSESYETNLEKENVSSSRKTASHLVDISLENHFSWAILIWRWIYNEGKSMSKIHAINSLGNEVVPEVALKVLEATKYHPIGQLGESDLVKTITQGIHDISAALGKHKYFQGETPGTVDCHAFAIFAQILWNMPGCPFEAILKRYSNLVDFVRRMKDAYWPDWNELILKPDDFEKTYGAFLRNNRSKIARRVVDADNKDASKRTGENENNNIDVHSLTENSKLPDPVAVTVLSRKDKGDEPASQKGKTSNQAHSESGSLPKGVLKPGSVTNESVKGVKPNSGGLISASQGSTRFTENSNKESNPSTEQPKPKILTSPLKPPIAPSKVLNADSSNPNGTMEYNEVQNTYSAPPSTQSKSQNILCPPPQEIREPTSRDESVTHVHKTSVKFVPSSSVESTVIPNQLYNLSMHQKQSNGNFRFASEMSKVNLESPMSEYRRLQLSETSQYQGAVPMQHTVYGQQNFTNVPPHVYAAGQVQAHFPQSNQTMFASGNVSTTSNNQQHQLTPEQLQRAAQAHLDNYYRQMDYQNNTANPQGPRQLPSFHAGSTLVPGYLAPNYDPVSPSARLLRF